jgi:hypothetical protein
MYQQDLGRASERCAVLVHRPFQGMLRRNMLAA